MGKSKEEKLFRYIKTGLLHRVRSLLKKSELDVNEIVDANGRSPLHVACILADDAIVRLLLKYDARTEARDHAGNTPLHLAIKNGLEMIDSNVYYDIVQPMILTSHKRILECKNLKGETVEKLLKKLKRKIEKEKKYRQQRLQKEEEILGERRAAMEEEKEWREKLRHEFDCENYSYESVDDFTLESTYESYDAWADRILHERREKARKMNEEKKKVRRECTTDQTEGEAFIREKTHQLESEHMEYIQQMREKCKKSKSYRLKFCYEEKCRNIFQDASRRESLAFSDIPWPCEGDAEKAVSLIVEWAQMEDSEESQRKYLKEQQVQWHPDRFMQRCGNMLSEQDKNQILNRVKEISQHLNALKK